MKKKPYGNITSFLFSTAGVTAEQCSAYSAVREGDETLIKISRFIESKGTLEIEFRTSLEILSDLKNLILDNNLDLWDGFKPISFTKLDETGFRFEVIFDNKTRISAESYC